MLRDEYGVEVAMLADEVPTLDRDRWIRILDLMIERQVGVKLLMETRVGDIVRDEDIMPKYRQAGVEHIYVGVEAGDQARLNMFKKGTKVEQSRRAIEIINENGLNTADTSSIEVIEKHMIGFLFKEGDMGATPEGFRPPGAKK